MKRHNKCKIKLKNPQNLIRGFCKSKEFPISLIFLDGIKLVLTSFSCLECVDRQAREFCKRFQIDCSNRYSKSGEQIRLFCPATCQECGGKKGKQHQQVFRPSRSTMFNKRTSF